MTDARPPAEALFLAVADADAATRAALLDAAPPEVRAEAETLLRADAEADAFFERPRGLTLASETALPPEDDLEPGDRVGPYRIEGVAGRGGMGTVYRAERADGLFEQTVALKLVRRGMASADLLARAAAERQTLARLQHPGIARLLGAGEADDGRPYLAMEFVDGEPLLDYAESHQLSIEERLRLFLQICDAVAAAHRALVVHRDLKPANVLVEGWRDERGVRDEAGAPPSPLPHPLSPTVKLLDFGIAKALDDGDDLTRAAHRPLTPAYAAPEQLAGGPITTAVDVWALGALLHELLTGARATDSRETTRTRASGAAHRQPGGAPLARRLRGDLDAIVQKALREEPDARYPSADALADDVRRHLDGFPVRARQGTARYLAGRFVRRHRVGVVAAAGLAVLAGAFVGLLVREQAETRAALAEAEAVAEFLEGLFYENDVGGGNGEAFTVRQVLDAGARRAADLAGEPGVHSRMLDVMGRTYRALLDYDRADSLLQEAVRIRSEAFGPDDDRTLQSLHHLGYLREAQGRTEDAADLYRLVLAARRQRDDPQAIVESTGELANLLVDLGQVDEARALVAEGLAALDRAARRGGGDPQFGRGHLTQTLGLIALAEGDTEAAVRDLRESRDLYAAGLGLRDHIYVAFVERSLAHALLDAGRDAEADTILAHAERVLAAELPSFHPAAMAARLERARLHLLAGDATGAEALARSALADAHTAQPPEDDLIARASLRLAEALAAQERTAEARATLESVGPYVRALPEASDVRRHARSIARDLGISLW